MDKTRCLKHTGPNLMEPPEAFTTGKMKGSELRAT